MSQNTFQISKPETSKQKHTRHHGGPGDGRGRKFFQQMQPTFTIELEKAKTPELEFLDHSDPRKSLVVRKKAREWVNRNKELSKQGRSGKSQSHSNEMVWVNTQAEAKKKAAAGRRKEESELALDGLKPVRLNEFDPFNLLPNVGRKYDHIVQFFLTGCPEEIPCSDDKYSQDSLVPFSHENTVLGNMAKSELTFILWLYATVSLRDSMTFGTVDTEEVRWFCNKTLQGMQEALRKAMELGEYSEDLIKSITCIGATASISGMFKAAVLHRDALVRIVTLRGNGDIISGLQSLGLWTVKAIQWCEFLVCTQVVEVPRFPYLAQVTTASPPQHVLDRASKLASLSLQNLPPLSPPLQTALQLLHLVGTAYAQPRGGPKIDAYIIQPLYDAEYGLLQLLTAQQQPDHGFSPVEILLAEALQLYFWMGPRTLAPLAKLSSVLLSRVMKALLPLLLESVPDLDIEEGEETATSILEGTYPSLPKVPNWFVRPNLHSEGINKAIAWTLVLGAIHTSTILSPEHTWFMERLRLQLQFMGCDREEEKFWRLLEVFPCMDGFKSIDLKSFFGMLQK